MMRIYNVYCDESCHLENDESHVMVLGATWMSIRTASKFAERLRALKVQYGLGPTFEMKWTKVSPARLDFYLAAVDMFFDDRGTHFRGLVVPDKSRLRHADFRQSHDDWYFKMYFDMLKVIFVPSCRYRIYLDIKDTRSSDKVRTLHEVLCNELYDFDRGIVERLQVVRSHEVEALQTTDLLIGALSYVNRGLTDSAAKLALVERIRKRSGYRLDTSTLLRETKFNVFVWRAQETRHDG